MVLVVCSVDLRASSIKVFSSGEFWGIGAEVSSVESSLSLKVRAFTQNCEAFFAEGRRRKD